MEKITSLQNAKVRRWTALHQKKERDHTGLFLIEGEHLIGEAKSAGAVETVITDEPERYAYADVEVTPQIMKKLSANVSAVHLIAVCRKKAAVPGSLKRVLILDGIQDPGNLGTLVRTAQSFSFDVVYCSPDTCDLYNEKVIRSTQGALFHMPVIYRSLPELIAELHEKGVVTAATTLQEAETMDQTGVYEKMAFVLGNEGNGVRPQIIEACQKRIRIEMHGFESLNVAVAGGIIMYRYRNE